MAEQPDTRVGVYIDFDNIVISRYDQRHRRGDFHRDNVRTFDPRDPASSDVARKLEDATVDLGAILDYASSFGPIAVNRAYADWSVPVNASYQKQLIDRAVDLVQLFPSVRSMKNGADIRLSIDVVEDLFRLDDITHVVIVAGDSDYIALAQRCKVLGRYVVGIGVAGATSGALASACDEFADYDALPGVETVTAPSPEPTEQKSSRRRAKSPKDVAADLLVRALQLGQSKTDDEWQPSGSVKNQMLRMDPAFQERALGFSSFSSFVKSHDAIVELDESTSARRMRLRAKQ